MKIIEVNKPAELKD